MEMNEHRKLILGQKSPSEFSELERRAIIEEYLSSGQTKQAIWEKYTGRVDEKGNLLKWMRTLGYSDAPIIRRTNSRLLMSETPPSSEPFERLQLEKRIAELEAELTEAKMKAIAYSTMIELAEQEFSISIRKKYNTKPSK